MRVKVGGIILEDVEKNIALLTYYVDIFSKNYPERQIGKTYLQKLMFLSTNEKLIDAGYTLYNYGPFSIDVANEIEKAEAQGNIAITWKMDNGYFIKPKVDIAIQEYFTEDQLELIDGIIEKTHQFNAVELSIVATAMYVKDKATDFDGLVKLVHAIKPKHGEDEIKDILIKSNLF